MNKGPGRSHAHGFVMHQDFLQAFLRKRGAKPEDVEDLLQETFVRCWPTLQRDPDVDHRKLLVTVIRNLFIDLYRRRRRMAGPLPEGYFETIPADTEGKRRHLQRVLLEKAVDEISERPESRFFKMHYHDGYKIQEIARLTRTSQGTVSSQIYRFRQRMQHSLCQELDAVDEFLA